MGCLLKRFDLIGRMVRVSVLACCALVLTAGLAADTVIMKDGRSIEGQITTQNRNEIQIRTTSGIQRLAKADVRRVIFSRRETPQDDAVRKAREERERAEQKARLEAEKAAQAEREAEAARAAEAAAAERARQEELRSRPRFNAIWRSVVLPGWGQYYQGRSGAAIGFGGGFAAALGLFAYSAQQSGAAQAAYESAASDLNFSVVLIGAAGLPLIDEEQTLRPQVFGLQFYTLQQRDAAYGLANQAGTRLAFSTLLLAGVYAANLIDVVLYKPSETTSVNVYAAPSGAGFRLQMSW